MAKYLLFCDWVLWIAECKLSCRDEILAFAYIRPWEQFLCALVGGVAFSIKILGFK